MEGDWGHCMHCRYFGCPAEVPLATEEAYCEQAEHARFKLTVFGTNGCTAFELRAGLSPGVEHPSRMTAPV